MVTEVDTGHYAHKLGLKKTGGNVDTQQQKEERTTFTKTGETIRGFASSSVPTLEETTILEGRPPSEQTKGDMKPILEEIGSPADAYEELERHDADPPEARVHDDSHQLFGAPAKASRGPQEDKEPPPNARTGKSSDASAEEQAAVQVRDVIRKHLSAKVGAKPWNLLTPTPVVDPHGFEDPISDEFWKNVWVACAVHNVWHLSRKGVLLRLTTVRPRFIARYSMRSQTTQ